MKALIAMSGGVDSAVAAYIMKSRGFECVGCTMKLYDNPDETPENFKSCCSADDVADARSVAYKLGIPYYVFNFKDEFREKVIKNFIECYEKGITPNPCIECNRHMKFAKLFERADILSCDHIVTGHYARVEEKEGKYYLKKAADELKDQSYVLYSLDQAQLSRVIFPLGEMTKQNVRKTAEENGFTNARKPDSQDICFVPGGDYAKVIEQNTGKKYEKGNFVTSDGKILGEHKGIIHYTVGQRRGLGIAAEESLYVLKISPENNTVTLGKVSELFKKSITVSNVNWISGEIPQGELLCKVKIRYRHPEKPAKITPLENNRVRIDFLEEERAPTPGQSAVFYDGDTVLGGGFIENCQ